MNKKLLIIFITVLSFAAGTTFGYFYFQKLQPKEAAKVELQESPFTESHLPEERASPETLEDLKPQSRDKPYQLQILGDENCQNKTEEALALLKAKAQLHYDLALKNIGIFECAEKGSGIYVWEEPPRYKVGQDTLNSDLIWYSSTIAHEYCHSKLYSDYLIENPQSIVPEDIYSGREAERKCLDVQHDALEKLGADQATLDYIKNVLDTEYWNIDYKDRWW